MQQQRQAHLLMAIGLFGIALWIIARQLFPSMMPSDLVQGMWVGSLTGLELLALSLMSQKKTAKAQATQRRRRF
ncbi:hypothetical protein [Undibacterium luofuense]|uniref:Uncharacterized protein n=1 Tax=Undibacterium luofuense TaxID=2828733 RepID=A0A941I9F6_9BURK|nr:hypothetical protein [Undibacterium luofuense]MBR7783788.1 hypothetical protein [Undibacterium luofuense]